MEINKEWLEDNILAGNINVLMPLLVATVKYNQSITVEEKLSRTKLIKRFQRRMNELTCRRIFKEEA